MARLFGIFVLGNSSNGKKKRVSSMMLADRPMDADSITAVAVPGAIVGLLERCIRKRWRHEGNGASGTSGQVWLPVLFCPSF